ncbi:hypothetical protein JKP88DRAFT_200347 [Tribonema minus]|uniref:15-oxoprostaglandin 13-reductase n=1 Tax=Tribonema minus TaxID=303371 RepID=A0A835YSH4_9STRA|nr:hypothetical protein JKP88DRAFT_200347 [Tribonema minus]
MAKEGKSIVLSAYCDSGYPGPEHFTIETVPVDDLADGGLLVQALVMSADPYLRASVKSNSGKPLGTPMSGFIAGKVLESKNAAWKAGDLFGASLPFTTVQVVTADQLSKTVSWKLSEFITEDQISLGIGVLGMPGVTAYAGLVDVLRPNEGETLFVSAASGAVGSLVGQIGKHVYKLKTIASAGGPKKCALCKDAFGYDEAIDYKTASNTAELTALLKAAAPDGIDMYFENVGSMHFEAALAALRAKGRIAVCGSISAYSDAAPQPCAIHPGQLIYKLQRIEGFMCAPWLGDPKGKALRAMAAWWKEGKLKVQETDYHGVERWPEAFNALFTGANVGKVVVHVA